jgi:hypothetical protein
MCPLCLSTAALLGLGGGTATTVAAVLIGFKRKGNEDGDDRSRSSDRDS